MLKELDAEDVEDDDEEFCLLYDVNRSKNPEFPYEEYGKFDLEEMDNSDL